MLEDTELNRYEVSNFAKPVGPRVPLFLCVSTHDSAHVFYRGLKANTIFHTGMVFHMLE